MNIVFHLKEMTFLRYFIPLGKHMHSKGWSVDFAISNSNKYNCPKMHFKKLTALLKTHLPEVLLLSSNDAKSIVYDCEIVIEGISADLSDKIYSLSYMTDFRLSIDSYYNKVSKICLPSLYFKEKFNIHDVNNKVIYVGSSKYDNLEEIPLDHHYANYSLLIYHPKVSIEILEREIAAELNEGRDVVIKTRGKHPVPKNKYSNSIEVVSDLEWYPHTTLRLIKSCRKIVNFDSTTIKEIVMMNRLSSTRNVKSKSFTPLEELYRLGSKEKFLWTHKNSSEIICRHIENE